LLFSSVNPSHVFWLQGGSMSMYVHIRNLDNHIPRFSGRKHLHNPIPKSAYPGLHPLLKGPITKVGLRSCLLTFILRIWKYIRQPNYSCYGYTILRVFKQMKVHNSVASKNPIYCSYLMENFSIFLQFKIFYILLLGIIMPLYIVYFVFICYITPPPFWLAVNPARVYLCKVF
jgi:hypothetical protein